MNIKKLTGILKKLKEIFSRSTNAGLILLVCSILNGCSTYSNSFACGDARGAACISMDRVDRMIASGEIERFNEARNKCRGRKCRQLQQNDILQQEVTTGSMQTHFTGKDKKQVQVE